jgi:hypothetical protein
MFTAGGGKPTHTLEKGNISAADVKCIIDALLV